ncbi:alkaline phosphatase family protein [Pendulispora brunnea]|uniref:Alkaline phosphatase family protein n=1 Tax=Pendulispora brunnea TaxID=2905690 RepID=A0ABZ2KH99_9BACT
MRKLPFSILALGACVAAAALGACASDDTLVHVPPTTDAGTDATVTADAGTDAGPATLSSIKHVVVIFLENHSFDNLYGSYPGAEGLAAAGTKGVQVDATNTPYAKLPQNDPNIPDNRIDNGPFDLTKYVPNDKQTTNDVTHRFYHEQMQINAGKMDSFAAYNDDSKGLAMGFYPTASLPFVQFLNTISSQVTVCDHFFHAAFGGSFLNHIWLIAGATPYFEGAPDFMKAQVDSNGRMTKDGILTPDGYAVNTVFSVNLPHPTIDETKTRYLPNQKAKDIPTIGDQLSAAGVDWAWYSGGWNDAIAGNADPLFQYHHQPFIYFENYADGTAAKTQHLKDEADFIAAAKAGKLPAVSFVKPVGVDNEHPKYANMVRGQTHTVDLIKDVMGSATWNDTAIIVTYDENGGFWDHVAPPTTDKWGPGSRIPAVIISPYAKGGIDSTVYDTTAILKLIEKRWALPDLNARVGGQADLSAHAFKFAN